MIGDDPCAEADWLATYRAPETRGVEVASGVSIEYFQQGADEGVPIVLVHGVGDSFRSFEPLLAHLPDDVHVVVPSLRGDGATDRPEHGYALLTTSKTSKCCSTPLACPRR